MDIDTTYAGVRSKRLEVVVTSALMLVASLLDTLDQSEGPELPDWEADQSETTTIRYTTEDLVLACYVPHIIVIVYTPHTCLWFLSR